MADNLSVYDTAKLMKDSFKESGFTVGNTLKACFSAVAYPFKQANKLISGKARELTGHIVKGEDDKVQVPANQKTLLGKPFDSLYMSSSTSTMTTKDAQGNVADVTYLKGGSEYPTEMHSSYLSRADYTDYASLDDGTKICYETTLLMKQMAYQNVLGDNDKLQELQGTLNQYKEYCSANGMDWGRVLYNVSNELQIETEDYLPQLNDLTEGLASHAENGRYLANSTHKMLLEIAPQGFEDYKIQSIDYEKTLDTNAMPHNFFCVYGSKIANYVSDKIHNFGKPKEEQAVVEDDKGFHPFKALKQTVSDLVLKFSYATAVNRVQTEYKNNGQEISYEQAKQIYDAKETQTSKDYNSRFNQTVATLGVSTESTEPTGPELQND